jgi:hypothetical protein
MEADFLMSLATELTTAAVRELPLQRRERERARVIVPEFIPEVPE